MCQKNIYLYHIADAAHFFIQIKRTRKCSINPTEHFRPNCSAKKPQEETSPLKSVHNPVADGLFLIQSIQPQRLIKELLFAGQWIVGL